jgi:UDP-N-acetyl-D-mannosaminuronic acid dehydrogenase
LISLGNNKVAGSIDVTVIGGAGHVGLPLALCFADKGLNVMVQDINESALEVIRQGRMPALEYDSQPYLDRALASGRFHLTSRPEDIPATGAVIITIGTPVDEYLNPVHKVMKACLDAILPRLTDGQLVVLRSTVFPGTTDWLHHYLEEQGRKLLIAFCPERVVQGFAIRELQNMPQIVSGTTPEAEEAAAKLFGLLASDVVRVTPMEAEFAKLFNNAYRYIQFSATNQFFMIANSAGVNYHAIHDAMTKDYPRAKDMPRPGFSAGPCLFKDTMQLAAFANNQFSLGHNAMLVNEGLILYIIEQAERRFDLKRSTVGLLGMAFKAEVDDTRASLSYKLKKMLTLKAREVLTTKFFSFCYYNKIY